MRISFSNPWSSTFRSSNQHARLAIVAVVFLGVLLASLLLYDFDDGNKIAFRELSQANRSASRSPLTLSADFPPGDRESKSSFQRRVKRKLATATCIAAPREGDEYVVACRVRSAPRRKLLQFGSEAARSHGSVTDIVFDTVDDSDLDKSLDYGKDRSRRSTGAFTHPSIHHELIYYDLVGGHKSEFDFDLDGTGQVHVILAEATPAARILYVHGSIKDGKWNEEGFVLARYREPYSPRIAVLADANGEVHLFWTELRGSNERLVHVRADSVSQPNALEVVGEAENLTFLVVAMANGDIVVLCKAFNFEYFVPNWLAVQVGGDFSLNLRVLRKDDWSLWKRLKYPVPRGAPNVTRTPYLRDADITSATLEEDGPQQIRLRFPGNSGVLTIAYSLTNREPRDRNGDVSK